MDFEQIPRKFIILVSALMIVAGLWLGLWSLSRLPFFSSGMFVQTPINTEQPDSKNSASLESNADSPNATDPNALSSTQSSPAEVAAPDDAAQNPRPRKPIYIPLDDSVPAELRNRINRLAVAGFEIITNTLTTAETATDDQATKADLAPALTIDLTPEAGEELYEQYFVAAARFDTIDVDGNEEMIRQLWGFGSDGSESVDGGSSGGESETPGQFVALAILSETVPALITLLGAPGNNLLSDNLLGNSVQTFASVAALTDAVYAQGDLLALLPFDQLEPRLLVLPVDGQNPIENAFAFVPDEYPLRVSYYQHKGTVSDEQRPLLDALLSQLPTTNRDPAHLTVLAMTGVTAMVRITASQMDKFGNAWPADVVGHELAAADITHISNEVPFVPGCQTNTSANNLTFCSKPEYMAALDAVGVDVIGLTGNHQNDYGAEDALISLKIYADANLPVYGGGKNKEEAFAPLYLEHNGNRLAFLGANSYGPTFAWATDDGPGSAEFDLAIMSATIRSIKEKDLADLVIVDLQYQETYNVSPIVDQRQNFNALIRAGADIVTGVQSHVPQAVEFTEGRIVLFGLGNLFFDQMWSEQTRDGLIAKHTLYHGHHISTQLLTTILHEYGQPRWASPAERERILNRVFGASYWE